MPRRFTDQHGSNGQPVTLEQLQDKHAERLQEQHAEWSDDMRSQSPVSTPSALRSVIAAASLKPKTGNESAASASVSVIPVTQSTAPKPERCKRLAPAVMPGRFTDQHGSKGQPVTLEQLQDKHAERLQEQHAEWSDDMRSQSPVSTPSALRSVIAAASLKPKTGNESAASASVSVIPVLASLSNRVPVHSIGKVVRIIGDAESLSEGHLKRQCTPFSAPCAPSPDGLQILDGPPVREHQSLPSCPRNAWEKRSSAGLTQLWADRDELLVFTEADYVMTQADGNTDPLEEASLSRYGQCMSMTAQVLFKLFGLVPFQGRAGYLLPTIVNLILLWAATWPLVFSRDGHMHRQRLWSAFNGALMCLGMVMALSCLRRAQIQKLVAPECCPLRLHSQWISTIPSDLLAVSVFLAMQFSLTGWYLSQAQGQQCEHYDSLSLQLSHVVAAAVFAVLMFLKLHVLSCLDLMIDDFSRQYAELGDAEQGILRWSLIQATLNQASNRLEGSFLISFTAIVAGFAMLTADMLGSAEMLERGQACSGEASWLLQPLLMIISKGMLLIYVLLRAAHISHKCDRTKHFINSLLPPPSEDSSYLDTGRSYLVRYIDDSAAGFCIQGGRITVFAVMKLSYGMCALTFAIVTQAYSS
ncbi:unnamed protein product [Polarella glacialis]|uniref:Gustatory receptor n=1 Tax=Polarella glacialis TaxID=89957 RepID=A0A813ENN1_POLGL|nr:unnamed protein product [Polarella glacialis]